MIRRDFREILSGIFLSTVGGLIAGILLAFSTGNIVLIPGLLILIPGFLEMRGNISGSLSARLSSGLIIGAIKPGYRNQRILRGNVSATFILSVFLSFVLGLVAFAWTWIIFQTVVYEIILISLIAGVLSSIILIPVTIMSVFWLFRHDHDPNNIMGPYITSIGDIVSVASLLIAIMLV